MPGSLPPWLVLSRHHPSIPPLFKKISEIFPLACWNSQFPWNIHLSCVTFSLYNSPSILLLLFILWLTLPEKPFAIPYYEEFPIKINYIVLCLGDKLDGVSSCTQQLCANKFKAKSNQLLSMNPRRAEISCCTHQRLPYRKPGLLGDKWKNSITRWSSRGSEWNVYCPRKGCYDDHFSFLAYIIRSKPKWF